METLEDTIKELRFLAETPELTNLRNLATSEVRRALDSVRSNETLGRSSNVLNLFEHDMLVSNSLSALEPCSKFIEDVLAKKVEFQNVHPLFFHLVNFDLRGFGACEFFLRTPSWARLTTHGTSKIRIFRALEDDESEDIAIGLLNPPKAFDLLGRWAKVHVREAFPCFTGRYQTFYAQAALRPIAAEDWSMFIPQQVLLTNWPYFSL